MAEIMVAVLRIDPMLYTVKGFFFFFKMQTFAILQYLILQLIIMYWLFLSLSLFHNRPIPLNSTVLAETWVEKIERRKILLRFEIKTTEDQILIEGTALWIEMKKSWNCIGWKSM